MALRANGFELKPVGYVRAPWAVCAEIPVQGGPSEIVIEPEFADALDGVEGGSHLIVIGFLHQADRSVLRARPRKLAPDAPARGVFACRAPVRPNPLSLTVVELKRRDGLVLHVDPLDLVDGTPIVDLKSYSPGWDGVFAAQRRQRVPASALDDLQVRACLERDLRNHVGAPWRTPLARDALEAVFRAVRHFGVDPRDPELCASIGRCDLVADALMGMLGASFSNGRLRFEPTSRSPTLVFRVGTDRFDVELGDDDGSALAPVVVVSGPPGAGKTTAMLRLAELLSAGGARVGGFFQQTTVDELGRRGYDLVRFRDRSQPIVLARREAPRDQTTEAAPCPFVFSRDAFASGLAWIREDAASADVLVIDEVSKLEMGDGGHCDAVRWALALESRPLLLLSVRADQLSAVVERFELHDRIREHIQVPTTDAELAETARRYARDPALR
jgi:tRNA (adenine37-N6)-methyltransferase